MTRQMRVPAGAPVLVFAEVAAMPGGGPGDRGTFLRTGIGSNTFAGEDAGDDRATDGYRGRSLPRERSLSNVAHALRTPLTAVYFFISNVADGLFGELLPEQQTHLLMALENVHQLKAMLAELLESTEGDRSCPAVEPCPVPAMVPVIEAIACCRDNAIARQVEISSDAVALPFAWADAYRVRQILINLIDNATRCTRPGGVIEAAVRLSPDNDGMLEYSIRDTGCGLSPTQCERVFDRGVELTGREEFDHAQTRIGLGLGLCIARDLVVQHGGRLWLESQLGVGSIFRFTLPTFSLAGRCAHLMNAVNLDGGAATLLALDVVLDTDAEGGSLLQQVAQLVERSIDAAADVLLPWMPGEESSSAGRGRRTTMTAFVVACTGSAGSAAIAHRLGGELKTLANLARLEPALSARTLLLAPGELDERALEMTRHFQDWIQEHLAGGQQIAGKERWQ